MWTNYALVNTYNVGDRNCAPVLYYPDLGQLKDIRETDDYNNSIVGGGGLLYPEFVPKLKNIIKKSKKCVIWGLGSNTHNTTNLNYINEFNDCTLIGTRDINTPFNWVPCVSCKSDLFDNIDTNIINDIVVYKHTYEGIKGADKFKLMLNDQKELSTVIKFLSSANVVITNTYHGMYWATLLKKKVLCYKPFSSRFYHTKYSPIFIDNLELETINKAIDNATVYDNALSECRIANDNFYKKVLEL